MKHQLAQLMVAIAIGAVTLPAAQQGVTRYVRYSHQNLSRFVTLKPGDVIYTGTPGSTKAMKPGDVVEIEIEGIAVLRNRVERAKTD